MLLVSDIITDLVSSSWLRFIETILDSDYGYLLSFDPSQFNITRDGNDIAYITVIGDTLPNISFANYDTVNYAPLLYLLNDSIQHPLYIPPNVELWVPNPTKIYNFLRDLNLTN